MIIVLCIVYRGRAKCRVMLSSAVTRLNVDKRQVVLVAGYVYMYG